MRPSPVGCAVVVLACASASFAKPGGYDAAAEFSAASNPGGVWSYGSQATLGGAFALHANNGVIAGFDYWSAGPGLGNPSAFHNPTGATIPYGGSAEIHPGQLNMHPGELGEYSITRFTAPAAGDYSFSAVFIGEDYAFGTTTDVHLLVNNVAVYSGTVNGYHATAVSGSFTVTLALGSTIDAAVGWGANGHFFGDSTGLTFTVDLVPTPGAAALLGLGGLAAARPPRRRPFI